MTPASIRNRNPGACYPGHFARKWGATREEGLHSARDGRHRIATFPTAIHGAASMFDLLHNGRSGGRYIYRDKTLAAAIETWCGRHHVAAYLAGLQKRAGIAPDVVLTSAYLRSHETAVPLARAMAHHEAGQVFPLTEQEWVEAHAMAFGGGHLAPEWNANNDVPSPRPETRAAEAVAAVATPATAGTVTAASGVAALTGSLPSVETVASWQSSLAKVQELAGWGWTNWQWVAAAGVAYGLTTYVLPWWARERV